MAQFRYFLVPLHACAYLRALLNIWVNWRISARNSGGWRHGACIAFVVRQGVFKVVDAGCFGIHVF